MGQIVVNIRGYKSLRILDYILFLNAQIPTVLDHGAESNMAFDINTNKNKS